MLVRSRTVAMLLDRLVPLGHHDASVTDARSNRDLGLGWLYYSLIRVLKPSRVVIVGSFRGFSVVCMALALEDNNHGHLDFVDASTVDAFWLSKRAVREHFEVFGVANRITVHRMTTARFLRTSRNRRPLIDFLFVDGDHHEPAVRFDHAGFGSILAPSAHVAFHDSYVGGFGFTEWEVADYLSTLDLADYEAFTFTVRQGLTLLKRHLGPAARKRRLRDRRKLIAQARELLSAKRAKERRFAQLALSVAEDAAASERSANARVRFLLKSNTDLRRELRGAAASERRT